MGMAQGCRRGVRDHADRGVRADDDVRHPVRPVDGLRGVPPVPHPRGLLRDEGQPRQRHQRPRGDGPGHHLRGAHHDQRLPRLRR